MKKNEKKNEPAAIARHDGLVKDVVVVVHEVSLSCKKKEKKKKKTKLNLSKT